MFKARLVMKHTKKTATTVVPAARKKAVVHPTVVATTDPACECGRRVNSVPSAAPNAADICYRYVADLSLKHQCVVVGGHRVPYFRDQVQQVRLRRTGFLDGLGRIDEAPHACERCHSDLFSRHANTARVTLTRSKCMFRLHESLARQRKQQDNIAALPSPVTPASATRPLTEATLESLVIMVAA
ncbi:Aste57867_16202 [Aphanomyces stellatus]|uniref:Aste57867_16202 protein n=1 Tax=Aphanomyces stellatus TaxID=120398 RepID=A0A485L5N8_9STRA|nr:hypothetical protein As57867_016146 [Aphanomyces stellatus]VFT92980.1 Aste57867_16202 [Aphanomyces stellatus]